MKAVIGILVALSIGIICRIAGLPLPAPPVIVGALLVIAMTVGYITVDRLASHRAAKSKSLCGGPTGEAPSRERSVT